jgi:hypothetical protein
MLFIYHMKDNRCSGARSLLLLPVAFFRSPKIIEGEHSDGSRGHFQDNQLPGAHPQSYSQYPLQINVWHRWITGASAIKPYKILCERPGELTNYADFYYT